MAKSEELKVGTRVRVTVKESTVYGERGYITGVTLDKTCFNERWFWHVKLKGYKKPYKFYAEALEVLSGANDKEIFGNPLALMKWLENNDE